MNIQSTLCWERKLKIAEYLFNHLSPIPVRGYEAVLLVGVGLVRTNKNEAFLVVGVGLVRVNKNGAFLLVGVGLVRVNKNGAILVVGVGLVRTNKNAALIINAAVKESLLKTSSTATSRTHYLTQHTRNLSGLCCRFTILGTFF